MMLSDEHFFSFCRLLMLMSVKLLLMFTQVLVYFTLEPLCCLYMTDCSHNVIQYAPQQKFSEVSISLCEELGL